MSKNSLQLTTRRLVLRPTSVNDFNDLRCLWANETVVRYISGKPLSRADVWRRTLGKIGHWTAFGFGYWTVTDSETNAFVGEVGVAIGRRGVDGVPDDLPDAGWALMPEFHGSGYATEAIGCVLDWFDGTAEIDRTYCLLDPEHGASRRVAEKCGFGFAKEVPYADGQALVMFRDRLAAPSPAATSG